MIAGMFIVEIDFKKLKHTEDNIRVRYRSLKVI